MSGTKSSLITIGVLFTITVLWKLFSSSPDPDPDVIHRLSTQLEKNTQINRSLTGRIESFEQVLLSEQSIRHQLEQRLNQLEQLTLSSPEKVHIPSNLAPEDELNESLSSRIKAPTLQEKLLAEGIPLDTIQRIQQRIGQNRLARLQLRDQAIREEWIDSPEYIEKEQQLPGPTEGLRKEFGDRAYDQYLYAAGRPNRVIVREVFSGSAAEAANIQSGDIILSYASTHMYSMSDLQQATVEGNSGEAVLIEILRDELPFTTSVPRGPLGISMTLTRKPPE